LKNVITLAAVLALFASDVALATVENAAADTMLVRHTFTLAGTTPAQAWRALLTPGQWWPASHTWSGNASNLSLRAEAGGCFCERWADGAAEHGRVIFFKRDTLLRLDAPLGPLQEMGLSGLLQIALKPDGDATRAEVTFRVSGDSAHALDKLAPVIDGVLGEQFGRFADYAPDGKIAPPPDVVK
jgi:uncharacterized protein YndB with AHSA1/START domain